MAEYHGRSDQPGPNEFETTGERSAAELHREAAQLQERLQTFRSNVMQSMRDNDGLRYGEGMIVFGDITKDERDEHEIFTQTLIRVKPASDANEDDFYQPNIRIISTEGIALEGEQPTLVRDFSANEDGQLRYLAGLYSSDDPNYPSMEMSARRAEETEPILARFVLTESGIMVDENYRDFTPKLGIVAKVNNHDISVFPFGKSFSMHDTSQALSSGEELVAQTKAAKLLYVETPER